jgi:hypothetical protein
MGYLPDIERLSEMSLGIDGNNFEETVVEMESNHSALRIHHSNLCALRDERLSRLQKNKKKKKNK